MKKIKTVLKLEVPGGEATMSPPLGPILGQNGINIGEFVKRFNEVSQDRKGFLLNTKVIVYEDRTFDVVVGTPKTSDLIKKFAGIQKGSGSPNIQKVGKLKKEDLKKIAQMKLAELNTADLEKAIKTVEATAKNMGIEIE